MATQRGRGGLFEALCLRCRDWATGSEQDVTRWLQTTRCFGATSPPWEHDGLALAVCLPDALRLIPPPCNHLIAAQLRDPDGRFHSHSRRRFFLRGEHWGCCLPTSTYGTAESAQIAPCGERGTRHVVMPPGLILPLSAEDGRCGVVCERHSAELRTDGAIATRL